MDSDNLEQTETADATISDEAAPETPVEASTESTATEASDETTSGSDQLIDGKFRTEDARDQSYKELERKFHEQAGQLSELRRRLESSQSPSTVTADDPVEKIRAQRNQWSQYARQEGLSEQERIRALEQVALHSEEISYQRALADFRKQSTRQTAESILMNESRQVLSSYNNDLQNMQSPLYQGAAPTLQALLNAGYPDNDITRALVAGYTASRIGQGTKQAIQTDRKGLLQSLKTQAKKAVVSGAGGPVEVKSGSVTAKDIEKMSDKEFWEYDRRVQGV